MGNLFIAINGSDSDVNYPTGTFIPLILIVNRRAGVVGPWVTESENHLISILIYILGFYLHLLLHTALYRLT